MPQGGARAQDLGHLYYHYFFFWGGGTGGCDSKNISRGYTCLSEQSLLVFKGFAVLHEVSKPVGISGCFKRSCYARTPHKVQA